MNKIENYLGIANHDIQMANNSQELKSYVASILCENDELQKENEELKKQYCERIDCSGRIGNSKKVEELQNENQQLKDLINTILTFSFFKEECPLNFVFEDNSKEDEAQNIFYSDEYCENNCNDIYKECWLKYFKELQGSRE